MLAAIKNAQLIVHLTLLSAIVPANAHIFYGAVAEFVAFDPIEIDLLMFDDYFECIISIYRTRCDQNHHNAQP